MIWHWPQIVFAIFMLLHFAVHLGHHGQPRDPYNAGFAFVDFVFFAVILYFGGFWTGGVAP